MSNQSIFIVIGKIKVNNSMLTWADCGVATTYEILVSFYGEEIAATIPYLHEVVIHLMEFISMKLK